MVELSVVMPCYLGDYPNAASERHAKLERAVRSFLESEGDFTAELIIVSDGCPETVRDWERRCRSSGAAPSERELEPVAGRRMRLVEVPKQPLFSGEVRNAGLRQAEGALVAYLDSDDFVLPDHFEAIVTGLRQDHDWVMFDDQTYPGERREAKLEFAACGTSTVAHRRDLGAEWPSGYGHDFDFIQQLAMLSPRWTHIGPGGYIVCHLPHLRLEA